MVNNSETKNRPENKDAPKEGINYQYTKASISNAVEEENRILREAVNSLREEIDRYKAPSLMVAEVTDIVKSNAIIRIPNGNKFYVTVSKQVQKLEVGDSVLVEQKNLNIIDKIEMSKNFDVEKYVIIEKPTTTWEEIGGLSEQIIEIQEVIELPLKHPELFRKLGIEPPKGILLHGPPGTGKTLMAKAIANASDSTFIEIVASEIVQKFIGDGAKLIKEIFALARAKAPSIIFIDELDALCAKRIDLGTSGEREVQRTFMQLLAELDGFKNLDNVKLIGCTNRKDILDPAILRPGRLDRLIEVPNPGKEGIKQIYKIHSRKMPFDKKVNFEKIYELSKEFSGAEIKSVVTEAGYFAMREERDIVKEQDFMSAISKVKKGDKTTDHLKMFG